MANSIYETLWGTAQDVFDHIFGTEFSFQPMREVRNATPIPDPDRAPIASVIGIPVADGMEQNVGTQLSRSTVVVHFSFQAENFPEGIQRFDRFIRATGPNVVMTHLYEVETAMPDPEAIYRIKVRMKQIPIIST